MKSRKASLYDVRDIWQIVWKRKWLIVLPLILVTAATYSLSFLIQPEYEASTIISVKQDVQLSGELQRLLGTENQYGRDDRRRDELRGYYNELTSSLYIEQLAERLNLDQDPDLEARARQKAGAADDETLQAVKLSLLQSDLQQRINIQFAAQDQIQLMAQSTDAGQARDIANTLGAIFITEKLKQELTTLRSSQDFSDIQLQKYENDIAEKTTERTKVERQLLQIQLDDNITSEGNRSQIVSEIDGSNNEIDDNRRQERDLLSRLSSEHSLAVSNLTLTPSDKHGQFDRELRAELRGIADQMSKYTWSAPAVINSRLRQNTILSQIEAENRRQVDEQFSGQSAAARQTLLELFNVRSNLDFLYSKVQYLTAANEEMQAKMNRVPQLQAELNRLNEEIAATTDIRDRFQRQQEGSTISQALLQDASSSKYKVIEPAKRPLEPFKPDRQQILMMGLALGLVIGFGAALVVELLDNSLKKVEDVEEFLGLPVLGITPKADFMKRVSR